MSVTIESVIKSNPMGRWYIVLSDTTKEESMEVCLDIDEYAEKVEIMGNEHDGNIEIFWSKEDDVTPKQMNEVRLQIMNYEAELEAKKEVETHQSDGTPNFQG